MALLLLNFGILWALEEASPGAFGIRFLFAPPELLPMDGQQSRIRIPLGTKVFRLKCPVKVDEDQRNSEEALIIKWSKEGEPLAGDHFRVMSNAERDLRIRTPQQKDSGRYRCTAINEWGHRVVDFELEVFDPNGSGGRGRGPPVDGGAPKWRNPSTLRLTKVQLAPGSALHLQCPQSVGNPLPQVIWTREGIPVSLELTNPNAASFSLDKIRPSDSATYSCRVQNQLGSIQADFNVQIGPSTAEDLSDDQILFGSASSGTFSPSSASALGSFPLPPTPRIDHQSQHRNETASVRAGLTAQLLCRVEWRREKSVIRWLRLMDNAEAVRVRVPNATVLRLGEMALLVLDQGNDAVRVEMDTRGERAFVNELRIPNVQKEVDSGRYFCVVTNPAGQFVFRSAFLRVLDSPSFPSLLILSSYPRLVLFLILLVLFVFILSVFLCVGCRSYHQKSFCGEASSSLPAKWCCPPGSSTASTTFASSASSSIPRHQKAVTCCGPLPPPPPRMPPPLFPPPSVSFANSPAPLWPFPQTTTLDRREEDAGRRTEEQQLPHSLHRTERGEDEMSRMSSHIYGVIDLSSGSPLPPSLHSHPPIYHQPPKLPTSHWDLVPRPPTLSPHQKAKLSSETKRANGIGTVARTNKEQKMPLIESHRESLEGWH
uniref:Ig-like domain-containing protein n=1 Tax=Globodera pallida TaxID=36090 RepID=A0A183BXM6_GLOPA